MLVIALPVSYCGAKPYPLRWMFVSRSLSQNEDVNDIDGIVRVASEHGLNGMVLSAGLDLLSRQSPEYLARLGQVKRICEQRHVEIIPNIFSVGYGGSTLAHDRNLAEGIPVKDAPFVVENGQAHLLVDPAIKIVNGGFEAHEGNRVKSFAFHDRPGEVSFVDTCMDSTIFSRWRPNAG